MNYEKYRLTKKDWIFIVLEYSAIVMILGYVFYDSVIAMLLMFVLFPWFVKHEKEKRCSKLREELDGQFIKSLGAVSTALMAGLSVENAFKETVTDMERLYGEKSIIVKELRYINSQMAYGKRIDEALNDFAERTGSDQISDFALVFSVAMQSGAGFAKIIASCIKLMQTNMETREEITVLIRGKQYEQKIMSIIPLGIVLYLRLSSGSFIHVLYHNITGVLVMSMCLIAYIISIIISERLCTIEV